MDSMNFVGIGIVGKGIIDIRDVGRGSLNYHHLQRIYMLPTGNLKVDLSHVNVGELSAELKITQDILNSLHRLCYHNLVIVDNLRLEVSAP